MIPDCEKPRRDLVDERAEIALKITEAQSEANAELFPAGAGTWSPPYVSEIAMLEEEDLRAREESEPEWYREQGKQLEAEERETEAERPLLRSRELRRTFGNNAGGLDQAAAA